MNSRHQRRVNQKWRRRQCVECRAIFTTLEQLDTSGALRVQSDNQYEPFVRDELFLSVYDSLRHRKTALADATALTETIMSSLSPSGDALIDRNKIIRETSRVLHRFDRVAAALYEALHPYSEIAK